MRRRIRDVHSGAEDRSCLSTRVERGDVRDAVDSPRHSAQHARAGAGERARQLAGHALAVHRCLTSSDDCHDGPIEHLEISDPPNAVRWVGKIQKRGGIIPFTQRDGDWRSNHGFTEAATVRPG